MLLLYWTIFTGRFRTLCGSNSSQKIFHGKAMNINAELLNINARLEVVPISSLIINDNSKLTKILKIIVLDYF